MEVNLEDLSFEQQISRAPYELQSYIRYAEASPSFSKTCTIYERAVRTLPRSYKLWKTYLTLRVEHINQISPVYEKEWEKVERLFDRALILLNKMPRIWEMYLDFMLRRPCITKTRRLFDRALRALALGQHVRIWNLYLDFARDAGGLTAITVWKRYISARQDERENYISLLLAMDDYQRACLEYISILNDPHFKSRQRKSHFQLWSELADLLVAYGDSIHDIDVDQIIMAGIERFSDQAGRLYAALATYHLSRDDIHRARDTFERGITTVMTVRDFSQIFDAYAEFEESYLSARIESSTDEEAELALLRFETLLNRRPFLLSDVILRQNPHNVGEWLNRIGLWGSDSKQVINTFTTAIATIKPKLASGKLSTLYFNFSKHYEDLGDLQAARRVLRKAIDVPYSRVDELVNVWIHFVEFELRHDQYDDSIALLKEATKSPRRSHIDYMDSSLSPQARLHKSIKLWSFYLDLVESVESVDETRRVYERVFELRIATPQTVVHYASFLEDNNYFEDAYKIYERGISLFEYPIAFELWNIYLTKAVERQLSMERLRDLFEQALSQCPSSMSSPIWILYANLELQRGLVRNALRIYERAEDACGLDKRAELFSLHLSAVAKNFGRPATRGVFERAMAMLPDAEARAYGLEFAELELALGEVDRARGVFTYASQFADPKVDVAFWEQWREFEVKCGNEDTFKEMLRVKRSVEASMATNARYIARAAAGVDTTGGPVGFIKGETVGGQVAKQNDEQTATPANDEIQVDV